MTANLFYLTGSVCFAVGTLINMGAFHWLASL